MKEGKWGGQKLPSKSPALLGLNAADMSIFYNEIREIYIG